MKKVINYFIIRYSEKLYYDITTCIREIRFRAISSTVAVNRLATFRNPREGETSHGPAINSAAWKLISPRREFPLLSFIIRASNTVFIARHSARLCRLVKTVRVRRAVLSCKRVERGQGGGREKLAESGNNGEAERRRRREEEEGGRIKCKWLLPDLSSTKQTER